MERDVAYDVSVFKSNHHSKWKVYMYATIKKPRVRLNLTQREREIESEKGTRGGGGERRARERKVKKSSLFGFLLSSF